MRQAVARFLFVVLLVLVWSDAALACPVCFQMEDSPAAQGVRAAVLVLVGVTAGVLTAVAIFAARVWRRAGS